MIIGNRGLGVPKQDLNLLARFAIAGFLDEPEKHLAKLLRSSEPIEDETRSAIANALEAKSTAGQLKFGERGEGKALRRFRKKRADIQIGREVRELQKRLRYEDAIEEVSKRPGERRGVKAIEKCVTLSRKLDEWVEGLRAAGSQHSELALECAFVYRPTGSNDSDNPIKPSLETLANMIATLDGLEDFARGKPFELPESIWSSTSKRDSE